MKLNMWMIANRVRELEPELHLEENEPVILNSARTVYATNCVQIYEENGRIICRHDKSSIIFSDISLKQGLEIIQGVFDFYEDWLEGITECIFNSAYQRLNDLLTLVLQNPVVIADSNARVLGISREYGPDSLDEEWSYMSTYGYASLKAISRLHNDCPGVNFLDPGLHRYRAFSHIGTTFGGLSYTMTNDGVECGRITVLERDRLINDGDTKLITKVANLLELELMRKANRGIREESNVFLSLIEGKAYSTKELAAQFTRMGWKEKDRLYIAIIALKPSTESRPFYRNHLEAIQQQIARYVPDSVAFRKDDHIILITNYGLMQNPLVMQFLTQLRKQNPITIALALSCLELDRLGDHYDQALFALHFGELSSPEQPDWLPFLDCSIEYILQADDMKKKHSACCPEILMIYNTDDPDRALFRTLKCYLTTNSLQKTAADLFIHRNTAQYRIHKLQELIPCNFDDPYYREYLMLSVRIIELMEILKNK